MKKLFPFLSLFLLAACGDKDSPANTDSKNILENMTYSVDTVMVDSKGSLFELNWGPRSSSVSENGKYLFLFNSRTHQVQQVNLDQLEWERDFDFEVEGPNGISDTVLKTQTLDDSTFIITAFNKLGIFSKEGTKLKNLSISSLPLESDLQELDYGLILTKDLKNIFSLPGVRYQGPRTFAKINLQTYEIDNFPINEMNWIFDLKIGTSSHAVFQESMYLVEENNQILALSPSSSSFYRYDLKTDSLSYHSFIHQLSPIINETKLKTIVESDEEYQEEMKSFFLGMYFGPLKWDESNELYFRFGRKADSIDETWQITSSQVFMYAYDENFNLIGEAELPKEIKFPREFFFKDGKLWSYVNVEDELGFAVLTFDF